MLLTISSAQKALAREVAQARMNGHARRRPEHGPANWDREFYGALGEIVVMAVLETLADAPTSAPLVAERPPERPDQVWPDGASGDVKAVLPGNRYLCINLAAHHNVHKRPDAYLPVLFLNEERARLLCPVPHSEVTTWRLMQNGHSPYYSTDVRCLRPLPCPALLRPFMAQEGDPFSESDDAS